MVDYTEKANEFALTVSGGYCTIDDEESILIREALALKPTFDFNKAIESFPLNREKYEEALEKGDKTVINFFISLG